MDKVKASRPTKARRKPKPKVETPEPQHSENNIAKPTPIIAQPTIGVDPNLVTTVGLGNLKVVTAKGYKEQKE